MSYFEKLAKIIRYYILYMVHQADSGHTTSALSSVELMTVLFFRFLRQDLDNLAMRSNDRVIFSKGQASPLMYALYAVAGKLSLDDLAKFRHVDSPLEGHPTTRFKYAEVATGSLGQGLAIGLGMAYGIKYFDNLPSKVYVLMGDGEMAEGEIWETLSLASYYSIDNLIGIVDVNRLGQSQETQHGWDMEKYERRVRAFGWETQVIDGHDFAEILSAYEWAQNTSKPTMILARTIKGKGVSFWENQNGWHSKPIPKDRYVEAIKDLGEIDFSIQGTIARPTEVVLEDRPTMSVPDVYYQSDERVSTKKAFGNALVRLAPRYPTLVVLDGDVKNSTHVDMFAEKYSEQFIQCFIAEQNMVGLAEGLSLRGKKPFIVTFAAFLTRAFDQFRMAALGKVNLLVNGSYVGASIGKDGPSNMGLEDIAMFRTIQGSIILYPADGVSTEKLVENMLQSTNRSIVYMRTTREVLPLLYDNREEFSIGGSKVLQRSNEDRVTLVGAGITVYEALKAYELLKAEGIMSRVIDCYSIKPIDEEGLRLAASETKGAVVVVEDHWHEGGLGDAVLNVFATEPRAKVLKLAVCTTPSSGEPMDVLQQVGIDAASIKHQVKKFLRLVD